MVNKCPGNFDESLKPIFDHKFGTDTIFFKNFEKSFELPDGLNFTHMKTLLLLDYKGFCPMSELSHMMLLEKGSFTPVAAKLIDKGFIRKERSSEDKRVYNLVMTEPGHELSLRFRTAHGEYIRSVLDCLTDDEQAEYHGHLNALNILNLKLEKKKGLD